MDTLRLIAKLFVMITSCVMLVAAAYVTFFWGIDTTVSIKVLWQILGSSALCSLCGLFFTVGKKEPSKKNMFIRNILSFIYVNAVVLICAFAFEWIRNRDPLMIIAMELSIIAVFAAVYLTNYFSARREAEKMNQVLSRYDKERR